MLMLYFSQYRPNYQALLNAYNKQHGKPEEKLSDEVLNFLKQSDRKMEYLEYDLKKETWLIDPDKETAVFICGREDSMDRLREAGQEFSTEQQPIEELVTQAIMLEKLRQAMTQLDEDERYLLEEIFYSQRTEAEMAETLGITQQAVSKRKKSILLKLKKIMKI